MRRPPQAVLATALLVTALLALPCSPVAAVTRTAPAVPVTGAVADDQLTWGVAPASAHGPDGRESFSYHVAPGASVSDWVAVSNYSAVPATFRVYATDATTDYDTAAFSLIGAEQAPTGPGAWTSVHGGPSSCPDATDAACVAGLGVSVTVPAGQTLNLPFTIAVPTDATPGDHAAGVVAQAVSGTPADGSGVTRQVRIGARVYLRVDGALTSRLSVAGAVVGYHGHLAPWSAGTATVGFDLKNAGNTRVSAQPDVRLTGPFGLHLGTVATRPVADLLPGGVARVSATVTGVHPWLLLFAHVTVTGLPPDAAVSGDPLPAAASASAMTWAVPWVLLAVLLLVVAGVLLLVRWRARNRRRLAGDLAAYTEWVRAQERAALTGPDRAAGASR